MSENSSGSEFKRFSGKGVFPPRYAFTLLLPFRNIFLLPKKLIHRLELQKDSVVLEVGPGPGYFSPHVARAIPEGKLVLADIQQEMLDYARKRLEKRKITNVEYYRCNGHDLPFSDNSFDVIFLVTVFGEVEHKKEYVREFQRILKPGGLLSVSEQAGDPDRLSKDEIRDLLRDTGFKLYKTFGNRKNYTLNFKKSEC